MLKRVFLQRLTHLGTQTEYLLAKYPERDPLDTNATWIHRYMDMPCKIRVRMTMRCQQRLKLKLYAVITQLQTRLRRCILNWTCHRN